MHRYMYCPFHVLVQSNFRRYFYFLPDQAQNLLDHFNVCRRNSEAKFQLDSTTNEDFPHRPPVPIVKIARFRQRYIFAENSFALGHETHNNQTAASEAL